MAKNEKGFTLIEVVASLVIITIVLLSFVTIFTSANKTATTNTEKLVVVNLADAQLERLKIEGLSPSQQRRLFNVVVTVTAPNSTAKGFVEG